MDFNFSIFSANQSVSKKEMIAASSELIQMTIDLFYIKQPPSDQQRAHSLAAVSPRRYVFTYAAQRRAFEHLLLPVSIKSNISSVA